MKPFVILKVAMTLDGKIGHRGRTIKMDNRRKVTNNGSPLKKQR